MTERAVTGDVPVSRYRRSQKLAAQLGLTDADLTVLADGVREFDTTQSPEHRQTRALEKIAQNVGDERDPAREYEARKMRRREIAAAELAAIALLADDEDVEKIKAGQTYKLMFARVTGGFDGGGPVT